jgi:hypothetical protein
MQPPLPPLSEMDIRMRTARLAVLVASLALLLTACGASGGASGTDYVYGTFSVTRIDPPPPAALPAEIDLFVHGEFPDACTEIDQVSQQRDGTRVVITLTTRRPAAMSCAQGVVAHTERLRLGTFEQGGSYVFEVNGVRLLATVGVPPTPEVGAFDAPLTTRIETPDGHLSVMAPAGWATAIANGEVRIAALPEALLDGSFFPAARLVLTVATGPWKGEDFQLDQASLFEVYAFFSLMGSSLVGQPSPLAEGRWEGLTAHRGNTVDGDRDLRVLVIDGQTLLVSRAYAPPGEWTAFEPLLNAILETLDVR